MNTTEQVARETTSGIFTELAELCDAMNDDRLASWELARQKAAELYHTMDTVCVQIQARNGYAPLPVPDMTRIYLERAPAIRVNHRERTAEPMGTREFLDRPPQINSPEEDAAMDEAEAKAVDHAHVNPVFAPILDGLMGSMRRGA